ncbi:hypothetical protein [Labilithrix luteola]|nr:hypothetical protein [Labilithrix luteola]
MRTFSLLAALLAAAASVVAFASHDASAAETRAPTSRWHLFLDGTPIGPIEQSATNLSAKGAEQMIVVSPAAMSAGFWSWLTPAFAGQDPKRTVTVVGFADARPAIASQLPSASLRTFALPALEANNRSPVTFSLTTNAATIQQTTPLDARLSSGSRPWLTSDYRVEIDGMPTSRVASVSPITISFASRPQPPAGVHPVAVGSPKTVTKGTSVTSSPLVIKVASADAPAFQQWLASAATTKRSGSLKFLTQDLREPHLTVSFKALTITKVSSDTASQGPAGRATVEMNVEGIALSPP